MLISDLKYGDVLLYVESPKYSSILVKSIRLIIGSKYTHSSIYIDDGSKFVLEQLLLRVITFIYDYKLEVGEEICVVRPKFEVKPIKEDLYKHKPYGVFSILDDALNHLFGRLTFGNWKHRCMLGKFSSNRTCSALVAECLDLANNVSWCYDNRMVEPDDYFNHSKDFDFLGKLEIK